MLFEHQVLHSLHHKLRAAVHHSGEQAAEQNHIYWIIQKVEIISQLALIVFKFDLFVKLYVTYMVSMSCLGLPHGFDSTVAVVGRRGGHLGKRPGKDETRVTTMMMMMMMVQHDT